jgi:hypothetical protein
MDDLQRGAIFEKLITPPGLSAPQLVAEIDGLGGDLDDAWAIVEATCDTFPELVLSGAELAEAEAWVRSDARGSEWPPSFAKASQPFREARIVATQAAVTLAERELARINEQIAQAKLPRPGDNRHSAGDRVLFLRSDELDASAVVTDITLQLRLAQRILAEDRDALTDREIRASGARIRAMKA